MDLNLAQKASEERAAIVDSNKEIKTAIAETTNALNGVAEKLNAIAEAQVAQREIKSDNANVLSAEENAINTIKKYNRKASESIKEAILQKKSKTEVELTADEKNELFSAMAELEIKGGAAKKAEYVNQMVRENQAGIPILEVKKYVENTNPDGGYLARPAEDGGILTSKTSELQVEALVKKMNIESNEMDIILDNGKLEANWDWEEGEDQITDTSKLDALTIHTSYISANVPCSRQLVEDGKIDIASYINEKINKAFTRKMEQAILVGDATKNSPRGILTYEEQKETDYVDSVFVPRKNVIETKTLDGSATLQDFGDMLISLFYSTLNAGYQSNAVWVMHPTTFNVIRTIKSNTGEYLLDPRILKEGGTATLLGRPVVQSKYAPVMFTDGDFNKKVSGIKGIILGDFTGYIELNRNTGVRRVDNWTAGIKTFLFQVLERKGGAVADFNAFKIIKNA